jgi:succinate dehydrogenase/fumarate reductase flavoprotein subunit
MFPIRRLETDVAIVGGGIAGSRAAIEAARAGARVLLLTKGIYGSGTSVGPVVLAGVGAWAPPEDSVDLHFEGIVVTGRRFLLDQELARVLAAEAPERIAEMESFGAHLWDRTPAGRVAPYFEFSEETRLAEESHRYHKNRYVSCVREGMYNAYTGLNVLKSLKAEVRRLGVAVREETLGLELAARGQAVTGLVALDYLNGEILEVRAGAVVLATGSFSQLWYPWGLAGREMTGDGIAMALEAGAVVADLELIMTAYLPCVSPSWSGRHKLLQAVIECAPGYDPQYRIRWVNARGEEFMGRYLKALPAAYEDFYLAVIKAVHTEIEEGRGPLYMDYSNCPEPFLAEVAPFILRYMDKLGRTEGDYRLEVGPNPMWSFGGVKIAPDGASSLKGLYACGDASNATKDGFGASVACGVTTGLVFGKRAGESAAACALGAGGGGRGRGERFQELFERLASSPEGPSPLSLKQAIGALMRRHLHLKNEAGMRQALEGILALGAETLPRLKVASATQRYNYEIVEALECRHMLTVAEAFIRASLLRRESRRHLFLREDYPRRDDANWLRHIQIRRRGGRLELSTVPVEFPYLRPAADGLSPERSLA